MKSDTHSQFSTLTILFHWSIALGMIAMLAFGLYIEDLPRSPDKGALIGIHKSFGVIILLLAMARILWRVKNTFPEPLSQIPNWQENLAKLTHWVLIIGTALLPISGIMMSIGGGHNIAVFGFELIGRSNEEIEALSQAGHVLHALGGKLLIAFLILHIVGAIKHQHSDKDGTMKRMLGYKIEN